MSHTRLSHIVQRFDRLRRDTPDRPLIHLPLSATTLTAGHIWAAAGEQRRQLASCGIGPDHLVIYSAGNRPALLALWLACRSLDAALMPVDAGTPVRELAALAVRFGASHAVVPESADAATLGDPRPFVPGLALVAMRGTTPSPRIYRGAAVLKLTSGSTGLPKATFTTEAQLVEDEAHITSAMDIRPDDCQMAAIPLTHAYGIGNLVLPLLIRGTAMVLREGFVPHQFAADATAWGARVFPGVPFMFDHFSHHLPPGAWPRGLEVLISAGARLERATLRAFHGSFRLKIHSFYGTSETGGICYDDSTDLPEDGSVGRPMPGVTITLRPEDGGPADGGRVHVAGSAVASGYAGESGQASDAFSGGGFLTGDFGRLQDGGPLVLTGRASAFINVAGRKVQPEEVEAVLREMPGVADVRVLGAPDPARGQQIVACIVGAAADTGVLSVRRFCGARLAPHKIPRTILHLDRIPLTERGKTDRRLLEQLVEEHLRGVLGADVL
jgi:long-chain acyl-CoA synthetase